MLVLAWSGLVAAGLASTRPNVILVMIERWRLLDGKELYDVVADTAQRKDIASEYPEVVAHLLEIYQPYWDSVVPRLTPVRIA